MSTDNNEATCELNIDTKNEAKKANWNLLNNNLSSALKAWDKLSQEMADKCSPEEEQLREIKKILKDLQKRVDEFR